MTIELNQAALLLCIFGAKIENDNRRLFPTPENAFGYLEGISELKGKLGNVESDYETTSDYKLIDGKAELDKDQTEPEKEQLTFEHLTGGRTWM